MINFRFNSNGFVEFFWPFVFNHVWLNTRSTDAVVAGAARKLKAVF